MVNLTLTIDQSTLGKARERALAEKTSVNALVRDWLEKYASQRERAEKLIALMDEIFEKERPSSGGKKFSRDELYRTW